MNEHTQPTPPLAAKEKTALAGIHIDKGPAFLRRVAQRLQQSEAQDCLLAMDIEHFKLFNQWYGRAVGDAFLVNFSKVLHQMERETGAVAGYFGNDDFALLMPNTPAALERLRGLCNACVQQYSADIGFTPAFGGYVVEDRTVPVRTMYDCALVALAGVKGNYITRISWYDTSMLRSMEQEHLLLAEVQKGLENNEFCAYLQPQCNMVTGRIVGYEALIRWNHPTRGLIPPGDFIPLMERNGFVSRLDTFLWNQVAEEQHKWIETGNNLLSISVNVSRMDIYALDVVEYFSDLLKKYNLPPRALAVEITESAYAEDFEAITQVVQGLHELGISVLMDDFGSGYSSLNMLREIQVDVIKLDMQFLNFGSNKTARGARILEAIIDMAHMLGLNIVAEGVETKEQRQLLLDMGCQYAQGYYFFRPIPMREMKELILSGKVTVDLRGYHTRDIRRLDMRKLLQGELSNSVLVNDLLGGVALYRLHGERVTVDQANDKYFQVTGSDVGDLGHSGIDLFSLTYSQDQHILLDAFADAKTSGPNGASCEMRRIGADGRTRWLSLRLYYLQAQGQDEIFYGSVTDITRRKERENQLDNLCRRRKAAPAGAQDPQLEALPAAQRRQQEDLLGQISGSGTFGILRGELWDKFYYCSQGMAEMLGYDSGAQLIADNNGLLGEFMNHQDGESIRTHLEYARETGVECSVNYRVRRRDRHWSWVLCRCSMGELEDGRQVILCACTDVNEMMRLVQQQNEQSSLLLRQNAEMDFLLNDMSVGYYRLDADAGDTFNYVSNRFVEITGYTRAELAAKYDNCYTALVAPRERRRLEKVTHDAPMGEPVTLQYYLQGKNGPIYVTDQRRTILQKGVHIVQGVILDVTRDTERMNWAQLIRENTRDDYIRMLMKDGKYSYEVFADGLYKTLQAGRQGKPLLQTLEAGAYFRESVPAAQQVSLTRDVRRAVEQCRDFTALFDFTAADGWVHHLRFQGTFVSRDAAGTLYFCIMAETNRK